MAELDLRRWLSCFIRREMSSSKPSAVGDTPPQPHVCSHKYVKSYIIQRRRLFLYTPVMCSREAVNCALVASSADEIFYGNGKTSGKIGTYGARGGRERERQ